MKKKKIISVVLFVTLLIIVINAFNFYYDWYRPNVDKRNISNLKNIFLVYGYDTALANNLVEGKKTGYQSINITALKNNKDPKFTYYTTDSVQINYTVSFWTTPEFFKYNINTQMNILTNIYKTCRYYFPGEYKLDNIYYKNKEGFYSKDIFKFINNLITCINHHINDKNNIKDVQEVDSHLFDKEIKFPTDAFSIGELGIICLDTKEFMCKKVSFASQDINKDKIVIEFSSKGFKCPQMDFNCSTNSIKKFIGPQV